MKTLITFLLLLAVGIAEAAEQRFVPYNPATGHTLGGIVYTNGTFTGNGGGLTNLPFPLAGGDNVLGRLACAGTVPDDWTQVGTWTNTAAGWSPGTGTNSAYWLTNDLIRPSESRLVFTLQSTNARVAIGRTTWRDVATPGGMLAELDAGTATLNLRSNWAGIGSSLSGVYYSSAVGPLRTNVEYTLSIGMLWGGMNCVRWSDPLTTNSVTLFANNGGMAVGTNVFVSLSDGWTAKRWEHALTGSRTPTLIIYGDSNTSENYNRSTWSYLVASNLNFDAYICAMGGETAAHMPQWQANHLRILKPRFMLNALGANDIDQVVWTNAMDTFAANAASVGATPIFMTQSPRDTDDWSQRTNQNSYVTSLGYPIVNRGTALSVGNQPTGTILNPDYGSSIHYNEAGHRIVAERTIADVPSLMNWSRREHLVFNDAGSIGPVWDRHNALGLSASNVVVNGKLQLTPPSGLDGSTRVHLFSATGTTNITFSNARIGVGVPIPSEEVDIVGDIQLTGGIKWYGSEYLTVSDILRIKGAGTHIAVQSGTGLTNALFNNDGSLVMRSNVTATGFAATVGGLTLPVLSAAPSVSGNNGVLWLSNAAAPTLWITTTNGTFEH